MNNAAPLRIAVADDETSMLRALERLMRSVGMDAETYSSGPALLDAMRKRPADCIVLDLHMPKMSGFEVQAQLAGATHRIPVVIITGHHTPETQARALAGGAAAYLRKPVDEVALLDAIAAAIGQQVRTEGKEDLQ